jgi:hypothetical protein
MGAERDQIEAEAEELFLRIGLTEQTAKCAAFASPPSPAAAPTEANHECLMHAACRRMRPPAWAYPYDSPAELTGSGCFRALFWQSSGEFVLAKSIRMRAFHSRTVQLVQEFGEEPEVPPGTDGRHTRRRRR